MCLNPLQIYNPSKYINLHHGDPFKLVVPCGKCADCMKSKSSEWHFRLNYMFKDCLQHDGYVLFETLTYSDRFVPHIKDFLDVNDDYPCFSRKDIRYFLVRLRRMLDYRNLGSIRYFLVSEYGTSDFGTHRPHYHILVFAPKTIDPLLLCRFIKKCWKFGLTDWSAPFHGDDYILKNRVFNDYSLHGMRLANYVAKYVQKDSSFTKVVESRICQVLDSKYPDSDYCTLANRKSDETKLRNLMCQFHLQSKGFGLSFLGSPEFDLSEIFNTGMVKMVVPDNPNIYKHIPLPMYYFRHLFQHQIYIDGKRVWELTFDGVAYRKYSEQRKHRNFVMHLSDWLMNISSSLPSDLYEKAVDSVGSCDLDSLATYVLFLRGRYKSIVDYTPLSQKLDDVRFFHYGSMNDAIIYDKKFVTNKFLGNDIIGYDPIPERVYSRFDFANSFTYVDKELEYVYQVYLTCCQYQASPKQDTFDYRQKLEKLYKWLFAR